MFSRLGTLFLLNIQGLSLTTQKWEELKKLEDGSNGICIHMITETQHKFERVDLGKGYTRLTSMRET